MNLQATSGCSRHYQQNKPHNQLMKVTEESMLSYFKIVESNEEPQQRLTYTSPLENVKQLQWQLNNEYVAGHSWANQCYEMFASKQAST